MSLPFLAFNDINQKITSNYYFNELTVNILNVTTLVAQSLQLTNPTNQILFGSSGASGTYFSVPQPAQAQVITMPDGGTGASNFIISNSAAGQQINSGIKFLTSGGTAATLNYYEEDTLSLAAGGWTGSVSGAVASAGILVRVGKVVTLRLAACSGSFSGTATYNTVLPVRYRPAGTNMSYSVAISNTGGAQTMAGELIVRSSGLINVYPDPATSGWTTSMLVQDACVTYTTI